MAGKPPEGIAGSCPRAPGRGRCGRTGTGLQAKGLERDENLAFLADQGVRGGILPGHLLLWMVSGIPMPV
ncbi:MAG: hypothetical protein CW346_09670 [Bacillaceae bacterium]|nr:hypothetical protein [Bacillaceae bacterium]